MFAFLRRYGRDPERLGVFCRVAGTHVDGDVKGLSALIGLTIAWRVDQSDELCLIRAGTNYNLFSGANQELNMRRVILMFGCLAVMLPVYAGAENAGTYCNEMYPVDSYDPADRAQYVSECLDSYNDDEAETPSQVSEEAYSETQPVQTEQTDYYEGTVEDYVNTSESENYE